jgi:hypothetical protein
MSNSEYTQDKFEGDLKELEALLGQSLKGGVKSKKSSKKVVKPSKKVVKSGKKVVKPSKKVVKSGKKSKKSSKKGGSLYDESYTQIENEYNEFKNKMLKKNLKGGNSSLDIESEMDNMMGGNNSVMGIPSELDHDVMGVNKLSGGLAIKSEYRHFKISELNGKEVDFGTAEIKSDRTPLSAAKKLLKSIAHHVGLYGNDKGKLMATFKIRETTRGHAKEYGPYHGRYHKYTPSELKEATTKGGKIAFKMKPIVKKIKQKGDAKREAQRNAKIVNKLKGNKKNNLKGGN